MLKLLSRSEINTNAWNGCISASAQRIVYGYAWYLDAVLPAPSWKWNGVVLMNESGQYQAVLPIPLRRKQLVGITYEWVVHQPFFCQFLAVFCRDSALDLTPFFRVVQQSFRYGSVLTIQQSPTDLTMFDRVQPLSTQRIDLSLDYKRLYEKYTHDRKTNLRQALRTNWTVIDSTDPEPLLRLFRENQADTIPGGVADWAYGIFRNLLNELNQRGLATLRYAIINGRVEAGALFVQEGNRIIYLFNSASEIGRRGNARTLLIDQIIQQKAGQGCDGKPVVFDFESPEKSSIRAFYRSFGVVEESFLSIRWSRLNRLERIGLRLRNTLKKASVTN